MKTNRLYQQNVYLKQAEAVLTEVTEENGMLRAVFDASIFFPEGGGQLCDGGSIAGHKVLDVKEDKDADVVYHFLAKEGDELIAGGRYVQTLDWDRRFSHMQMHCGEHLISGAFYKLFGANNKGFHMGEDYVTIDIDWDGKELTADMIQQAELLANSWVWDDIPVEIRWFDTAKEAMSLPCRKEIKFGENISVVLIGNEKDPADCCACCGTHPSSTGQIGLIKITHHEKYKSMNRFYVKFGRRALEDYDSRQKILTVLANKYSCEAADLEKSLDAAKAREEELYRKYNNLKGYYQNIELDRIKEELAKPK